MESVCSSSAPDSSLTSISVPSASAAAMYPTNPSQQEQMGEWPATRRVVQLDARLLDDVLCGAFRSRLDALVLFIIL